MQTASNINFQVLIDNSDACKACPKGHKFDLEAAVGQLYQNKPDHPDFQDLVREIDKVYPGNRAIVSKSRDHIFLVCKAPVNVPLCLGVVDVSVKAFAKGGFGKVYPVQMINSDVELVLKLSRKNRNKKETKYAPLKAYYRELAAREDLKKERKMMEYICKKADDKTGLNCDVIGRVNYANQKGIFIKKYDMDGSEFASSRPDQDKCTWVILDLVKGMSTLHRLKILHRDLKLANVLIKNGSGEDFEAVISDFGNAIHFEDLFTKNQPYPTLRDIVGAGTRHWTSGFLVDKLLDNLRDLKNYKYGSEQYDIIVYDIKDLLIKYDEFSMSLIIYRLATGCMPPFQSYSDGDYFEFDEGLTSEDQYNLVDQMIDEVYRKSCFACSLEDAKGITDWFIDFFTQGLAFNGNRPYPSDDEDAAKSIATIDSSDTEFSDNKHVRKKKRYNSGSYAIHS